MPDSPNHVSLIQFVTSADSCNDLGVLNDDDVDNDLLSLIVILWNPLILFFAMRSRKF